MQKTSIPFSDISYFSGIFMDYISKKNSLTGFYKYAPENILHLKGFSEYSISETDRERLVNALEFQYQHLEIKSFSEQTKKNFELLKSQNTYTVTTGHQLCLFTGPLYFVYKIITTINLCERLKQKFPSENFVPVYWMASEDHDFEEINHFSLLSNKLTWNSDQKGAVGNFKTAELCSLLEEFKNTLGKTPFSETLIELFRHAYLKNNNLANATRYLVNHLFTSYGLVIIDGNDSSLKEIFKPVIEDDLLKHSAHQKVNQASQELQSLGYKPQVHAREINLFYTQSGLRERIEKQDENYTVVNTNIRFSKETILHELNSNPERFSPNVVLRPLYQQKILPNIAYVGGPGELAYWLQYKKMFDFYNISFPVLFPRNNALILDKNSQNRLAKLKLKSEEIFAPLDELIKLFIQKNAESTIDFSPIEIKLAETYSRLSEQVFKIDATLKPSVEAELQKVLNGLKNIDTKILRARKQKQEVSIEQIKKLKEKLFPGNSLQERVDNVGSFYAFMGDEFINILKASFDPFRFEMLVLEPD